jgi:hypothetical protein
MAHRDGCRDESSLAGEVLDQLPWDGRQERLAGLGAWGDVRLDAMVAASQALPKKPGADAGKSAGLELADRALDGLRWDALA